MNSRRRYGCKSPCISRHILTSCVFAVTAQIFAPLVAHAANLTVGTGSVVTVGARTGSTLSGFSGFTQNGSASINGGQTSATLTTNVEGQAGSVWTTAAQTFSNTNGFTASFIYTASGDRAADGATFTIQNDPSGAAALGPGGGSLGYANINNSVSYQMNIFNGSSSALNVNGLTGQYTGSNPYNLTLPSVDMASGHPISVTLDYTNGVFAETLIDTVTNGVYSYGYSADLNALLGGNVGRLGFTGGTGLYLSTQTISNFSFAFGPGNSQAVSADQIIVSGGVIKGTSGSLSAPIWTVSSGSVAIAGTAVSFNSFTQTGGDVALGNLNLASGKSYHIQGGTNVLTSLNIQSGADFALSSGTLSTPSISSAGNFSWTGGAVTVTGLGGITLDNSSLGSNLFIIPSKSLAVFHNTSIPSGSSFTLNGGNFSTSTLDVAGSVSLQSGHFSLTSQDIEISSTGIFGPTLFVGPDLHMNLGQNTHIAQEGRLVVAGGTYTSSTAFNEGAVSVIDGQFTLVGSSENDFYFDAIRSFVTFGTGESDRMVNYGTFNLIDTNVYGDLHNTSGALMRTAGDVVFFGQLTSDALINNNANLHFSAAGNSLTDVSGTGTLTVEDTADLTSNSLLLSGLTVNGTHTILANSSASKLSSLSIAHSGSNYTGKLDLTNNKLIFQSDPTIAGDKAAKIAALNAALISGSHGSTSYGLVWGGQGITSSTIAAPLSYGIGVWDNAIPAVQTANGGTFGGQGVDSNSILIHIAHIGDADGSGLVNIIDLSIVANAWQQPANNWGAGDLNGDGLVNIIDFTMVANNWQQTSSFSLTTDPVSLQISSPVPEPASLALLSFAPVILLRRRSTQCANRHAR